MKQLRHLAMAAAIAAAASPALGAKVLSLPMDIGGNALSGNGFSLNIEGRFAPMQIAGYGENNQAWRTDGNSSRAVGTIPSVVDGQKMTAVMRFAIDTYTIVEHENPGATERYVEVISCLDEGAKSGFGLFMNRTGKYTAKVYVGGQLIEMNVAERIPLWEWTEIAIVVDGTSVRLYCNGQQKASATATASGVKVGNSTLYVGRANASGNLGGTETCAFNGAFDDLSVYDEALQPAFVPKYADLNLPAERYANDRMRAHFHGQPGMNWTNETHGLFHNVNGDGKWHAFFQRTGSTPMMSHQHWGHIVSDDMITWRDDAPVLSPSESYDIKGCWSGCVFTDPAFNSGKPTILYTGVDFAKPYVATAFCDDVQTLRRWHKDPANPLQVTGDIGDGRDTYFYRDGENVYFLIGAVDAVHYYQWNGTKWNYKGEFYHTEQGVDNGHNTEMPNVTRFGDKWVMTTSPLAGQYGTVCLYRTGSLSDGKFVNYSGAERVDFFGCDGYGLLSPSPYTTSDGKVYAIGIVPDKLPGELNIKHGYAHLYSLPREWSLDSEGRLLQKPYEGIKAYRNPELVKKEEGLVLDGALNLHPVRGREAEICAKFLLSDATVGLNFFKNAKGKTAYISYNPANREIKIDYSQIAHYNNGRTAFSSVLPLGPTKGEELKLHVFIDHSIVDIFVNDRYAASVRVFPEDDNADLIELFSNGKTDLTSVEAYVLGEGDMSECPIVPLYPEDPNETLESTHKVALYMGYTSTEDFNDESHQYYAQDHLIYDSFKESFPECEMLYGNEAAKVKVANYDCIWVHCDRKYIEKGWQHLPQTYLDFVEPLKAYVKEGGNLYLTKMASQLVVALGRTEAAPEEFSNGDGGFNGDDWHINIAHHDGADWSDHIIFSGLDVIEAEYGKLILVNRGGYVREDHNCIWRLNDFGGHNAFCEVNDAKVLGTWGHNGGQDFAGLIEFHPRRESTGANRQASIDAANARMGTIITNGISGVEYNTQNAALSNVRHLTANILAYLSPVREVQTEVSSVEAAQSEAEYFTLQGMKASAPLAPGIYIERRGEKIRKILISK